MVTHNWCPDVCDLCQCSCQYFPRNMLIGVLCEVVNVVAQGAQPLMAEAETCCLRSKNGVPFQVRIDSCLWGSPEVPEFPLKFPRDSDRLMGLCKADVTHFLELPPKVYPIDPLVPFLLRETFFETARTHLRVSKKGIYIYIYLYTSIYTHGIYLYHTYRMIGLPA